MAKALKMQLCNSFLFVLLFHAINADKDVVPTFLLDYEGVMKHINVQPNPFYKMSATNFADIIHETIKHSEGVIVFIEDTFCSEDVAIKDRLGTPYKHLRQGLTEKKVQFFPGVIEPYKILNQIFQPQQFNVFYLGSDTRLQLMDNSKYIYVFFQNGLNETRVESLRRHDHIIGQVYFAVRQLKPGPIVAFYTGKVNPIKKERITFIPIQPVPIPRDLDITIVSQGGMFRFSGVYTATPTRRAIFNQMPIIAEETWSRMKLSTKMAYSDFELQFNFNLANAEGWILDNVALLEGGEEVGRTELSASAPWNWSYVCTEPLVLANTRDGSTVTISQYQVQPGWHMLPILRNGSENNDTSFGPSVNCGPYFSSNILTGLFISFICLGILANGVLMLFNCNSNDKFEDPSSKPLQQDAH